MVDIHGYHKRLERSVIRLEASTLSKTNKKYLFEFYQRCLAEGISAGKIHRYLDDLVRIGLSNTKLFSNTVTMWQF